MSRRAVLRRLWADEAGFSLPEVIAGTIVEAVVVSLVATAVFAFAVVDQGFQIQASNSSTAAVVATTWGETVAGATDIEVTDSSAATFSGPAVGGTCAEKRIAFVTVGARRLQLTTTPFTGAPDSITGACTGTAGAAAVAVLDGDAGVGDAMVFRSIAGRGMRFVGGTLTLDAGPAPAGVSAGAWASTIIGAAELDVTTNASSGHPAAVTISQLATGQTVIPPADAASTWTIL